MSGLLPGLAHAQPTTPLQAGELALLDYDTQDPDDFGFTPLVDLAPGTQVKFIDNGWLPIGGFRATEGICVYTAPAGGVPRGTVISLRADSVQFTRSGRFQLATDGDQLLAYQGPEASPTFLGCLAIKKTWSSVISSNTSALPPGLVVGSSAIFLSWSNGAYTAGSPRSGTVAGLRATLNNPANWSGSNTNYVSWLVTRLQVLATPPLAPPAGADSLRLKLYQVFANLDASQVPTGYLAEYSTAATPTGNCCTTTRPCARRAAAASATIMPYRVRPRRKASGLASKRKCSNSASGPFCRPGRRASQHCRLF